MDKFDVTIVGGGMVGAAMALSLSQLPLSICLIEQRAPQPFSPDSHADLRVSAINLGSESLFRELNVWQTILDMRTCPYLRLAVWEQSDKRVDFDAASIDESHLGHIIENHVIQQALWQALSATSVEIICPAEGLNISAGSEVSRKISVNDRQFETDLVIAADGARSKTRQAFNIGVTGWQYQQAAMLINISTDFPQQDITWQQFTPSGPKAFLPLNGNNGSLVWYDDINEVKRLASYTKQQLKAHIQDTYSALPGDFEVLNFAHFPLTRQHANQYVVEGGVLIGDAAHAINPLAGQGVNLGFRDVVALTETLTAALDNQQSIAELSVLKQYEKSRKLDNLLMMSAMDAIYAGFNQPSSPVQFARNAAFKVFNQITPLKKEFLKYAVGKR